MQIRSDPYETWLFLYKGFKKKWFHENRLFDSNFFSDSYCAFRQQASQDKDSFQVVEIKFRAKEIFLFYFT